MLPKDEVKIPNDVFKDVLGQKSEGIWLLRW
jgi:hypothetical protein